MKILPENPGSNCSVLVRKDTSHMATLPTGLIDYIEIPFTTVRPLHYRVKDINTLIHTVIHTYHPDIIGPVVNHYQDMTQNTASFEIIQLICITIILNLFHWSIMYNPLNNLLHILFLHCHIQKITCNF